MAAYRKPVSLKRRRLMLLTALNKYKHPECWGRIECAIAAQLIHCLLWEAKHDKNCPEDLLGLANDALPLIAQAAREPFLGMRRDAGDELIAASGDACILAKAEAIDGPIKPLAYFYTVYLWLQELLERGPERGGLVLGYGSAFDLGWKRIAEEMLLSAGLLPAIERSCQKRARRFKEAFASYGFFVDPAASHPVKEAA